MIVTTQNLIWTGQDPAGVSPELGLLAAQGQVKKILQTVSTLINEGLASPRTLETLAQLNINLEKLHQKPAETIPPLPLRFPAGTCTKPTIWDRR